MVVVVDAAAAAAAAAAAPSSSAVDSPLRPFSWVAKRRLLVIECKLWSLPPPCNCDACSNIGEGDIAMLFTRTVDDFDKSAVSQSMTPSLLCGASRMWYGLFRSYGLTARARCEPEPHEKMDAHA